MIDFNSAAKLLALCSENGWLISEAMKRRECDVGEVTMDQIKRRMERALAIMKEAVFTPLKEPMRSMGGLIGGEARALTAHYDKGEAICGDVLSRGIAYAMAVQEVNASMGVIVAAPTAGSAGVVPGLLLALQKQYHISDERVVDALFHAGAIGYLVMRNATVAGAASAAVELMGGSPEQSVSAASTVLMNMLGLVCDPVGGLVEYPCQNRNAAGVANALIAAELSLAGIRQMIPLDEMIDTMYQVGRRIPYELRETALGGCAATPSGCSFCHAD